MIISNKLINAKNLFDLLSERKSQIVKDIRRYLHADSSTQVELKLSRSLDNNLTVAYRVTHPDYQSITSLLLDTNEKSDSDIITYFSNSVQFRHMKITAVTLDDLYKYNCIDEANALYVATYIDRSDAHFPELHLLAACTSRKELRSTLAKAKQMNKETTKDLQIDVLKRNTVEDRYLESLD